MNRSFTALVAVMILGCLGFASPASAQCYQFAQYGSCCINQWGLQPAELCLACNPDEMYVITNDTYLGTYTSIPSGGWAKSAFPSGGPDISNGCIYDQQDCETCKYTRGITKNCKQYAQPSGPTTC